MKYVTDFVENMSLGGNALHNTDFNLFQLCCNCDFDDKNGFSTTKTPKVQKNDTYI